MSPFESAANGTSLLHRCVQPVQVSGPVKDTPVGCDKPVPAQSGGNYQAVCGVSVHFWQKAGAHSYLAVHRNFNETVLNKSPAPGIQSKAKVNLVLLDSHADLP